jgi:hypothetical protein
MDKKIAGVLGAVAALTAMNSAQAATPTQADGLASAASYRGLLEPVPNALALLNSEESQGGGVKTRGETRVAEHHHHHHRARRRHHHHHHHD